MPNEGHPEIITLVTHLIHVMNEGIRPTIMLLGLVSERQFVERVSPDAHAGLLQRLIGVRLRQVTSR
jgi:hypothetical protein